MRLDLAIHDSIVAFALWQEKSWGSKSWPNGILDNNSRRKAQPSPVLIGLLTQHHSVSDHAGMVGKCNGILALSLACIHLGAHGAS